MEPVIMVSWWLVAAARKAERKLQVTLEVTPPASLDSLCLHLHSLGGSVLTTTWHM